MAMSAEARKRISLAQKRRWAAYRKSPKAAQTGRKKTGARRGRPPKAGNNPYLNLTIQQLITAKQQFDEAWSIASKLIRGR